MSNILTSSRLRTFRACAYKHHLQYNLGWRPRRTGEALIVGTIAHRGLNAYFGALMDRASADEVRARTLAAVDAACEHVPADDERAPRASMIRTLLWRYASLYAERDLAAYDVLAVELPFTIPLVNPDTGAASRTWVFAGEVDAVVRERFGARRVLIVEHKTTADPVNDESTGYFRKLALDAQVSAYYMGAEKHGFTPEGCLYDVLRKPAHRLLRATPLEARKYTQPTKKDPTPRLYANQRDRDETCEEYEARVAEAIDGDVAAFFRRKDVSRTDDDLRDWLSEAWMYGRIIAEQGKAARHPRNTDECHRFSECPFWEHCAYKVALDQHPERWERLDNVHPELPEAASPDASA